MKRKIWIPIAVISAVLAILFLPIPKGVCNDGGTREYTALTYKIVKWSRLTDNGIYKKTRVYFGEDRWQDIDQLWLEESEKSPSTDVKGIFLEKAGKIKEYSKEHLEAAVTQYELNTESGTVCEKWEALLSEVNEHLKKALDESELDELQKNETEWLSEKESAINEAAEEWKGGSGEPMARNMAAIRCMEERFNYLISLLK